jgi:hypothetical protein
MTKTARTEAVPTDIVVRLRGRTDPSRMLMSYPGKPAPDMLCHEAADLIERFRAALTIIATQDPQALALDALRPRERIR